MFDFRGILGVPSRWEMENRLEARREWDGLRSSEPDLLAGVVPPTVLRLGENKIIASRVLLAEETNSWTVPRAEMRAVNPSGSRCVSRR